ncbi:MAG: PA14 domain-containing protein [Ilumatobacteraceae bacterium]
MATGQRPRRSGRDDAGFTLVEILIAIVLVGILSAVAVVGVSNLVGKGANASCRASADASSAAAAVYFTSYSSFPLTFTAMTTATGSGAAAIPPSLVLASGVSATGLVATSTRGSGWTLTMTPGTTSMAPTFACSTATAASTLTSTWPAVHNGQVGVGFAATGIPASGGVPPYAWSAPGIPRGLTIGPVSGTIYGTPTAAGTFPVTVTITDAASATVSRVYSIVVTEAIVVCPTAFVGWRGEYYGTADLSGPPALCRDDAHINFDWGWASSPSAALPLDEFSARWTRTQGFVAGTYTFTMGADDGSRLSVDGSVVLDRWVVQSYPAVPPSVHLALTGGDHVVVMEYFEHVASARATLSIAPAAAGVIVCSATPTGWLAEYFPNAALTGPASGCRDENGISVDWGAGAPLAGMPVDNFSVRWTRTQTYAAGAYTFTMGSDDGSRLLIDGVVVLDQWSDHGYPGSAPPVTRTLTQGAHTVVMEYYERAGGARATLVVTPAP